MIFMLIWYYSSFERKNVFYRERKKCILYLVRKILEIMNDFIDLKFIGVLFEYVEN